MAGYQWFHIESYALTGAEQNSKNGKQKKWSVKDIVEEVMREPQACTHVENPQEPTILFGCSPYDLEAACQNWADNTKDEIGRKLRKDSPVLLAGTISMPREMEQKDPKLWEEHKKRSIEFLEKKYQDRLVSVLEHQDEEHPHIHFYCIAKVGEKFEELHEGKKAQNLIKKKQKEWLKLHPEEKDTPKEMRKNAENRAYIMAMKKVQDEYQNEVGKFLGFARIGPGRRRLKRAEWKAEQQHNDNQAKNLRDWSNLKKVAKAGYQAGVKKAQEEFSRAGNRLGSVFKAALGTWHQPTLEAQQQAQKQAEKHKKELEEQKQKHRTEQAQTEAMAQNEIKQLEATVQKQANILSSYEKNEATWEKTAKYLAEKFPEDPVSKKVLDKLKK